jgi:hypothetical protein
MLEGLSVVICESIRTFCVVCKQGRNLCPFHLRRQNIFSFYRRVWCFNIDPSRVGINMSSSGQGTIPPQVANNAFICAYAFEQIVTPTHALPLCQ